MGWETVQNRNPNFIYIQSTPFSCPLAAGAMMVRCLGKGILNENELANRGNLAMDARVPYGETQYKTPGSPEESLSTSELCDLLNRIGLGTKFTYTDGEQETRKRMNGATPTNPVLVGVGNDPDTFRHAVVVVSGHGSYFSVYDPDPNVRVGEAAANQFPIYRSVTNLPPLKFQDCISFSEKPPSKVPLKLHLKRR